MKVKLADIECNPNRDLKFNPFNEEKITALMSSISETGFWANVILRPHPETKGKYQQAYGHHRTEAARRSNIVSAEFIVQKLDDDMMLKMMELENAPDYKYFPLSLLETCRAAVKALAEGRISPFKHDGKVRDITLRYAPSFSVGASSSKLELHAYTVLDIARRLGRTKAGNDQAEQDVRTALDALYLLEIHAIKTSDIRDMNWATLGKFVSDLKKRKEIEKRNSLEAAAQAKKISDEIAAKEKANKEAAAKIQKEREAVRKKQQEAIANKAKEEAEQYKERQKELDRIDKEREEKIRKELPKLEEKIKRVHTEVVKKSKAKEQSTALSKQLDALIFKLEAMIDIKGTIQEDINQLHRKLEDTTQRMRLRNALSAASTFFDEHSIKFFGNPPAKKTGGEVLRDAAQREEAKRKMATTTWPPEEFQKEK